jgi:hypothetical protein
MEFWQRRRLPGMDGFHLADVATLAALNSLPEGVKGLVWLGMCNGADNASTAAVEPFIGNTRLFAFYLMDEPDPTGRYSPLCPAANLKAEAEWIHANVPGAETSIVVMNMGLGCQPDLRQHRQLRKHRHRSVWHRSLSAQDRLQRLQ